MSYHTIAVPKQQLTTNIQQTEQKSTFTPLTFNLQRLVATQYYLLFFYICV